MAFEEAEVLATFDRTFGDSKEELRLERGTYKDRPTFTLRLYWQGGDGKWRWVAQKPTQSGKCWERMNLKAKELRALGQALIDASKNTSTAPARPRASEPSFNEPANFGEPQDDDIPF